MDSTISENSALNADAGGVWVGVGPLTLVNSVVAGNVAAGVHADLRVDNAGSGAGAMFAALEVNVAIAVATSVGVPHVGARETSLVSREVGRPLRTPINSRAADVVLSDWVASERCAGRLASSTEVVLGREQFAVVAEESPLRGVWHKFAAPLDPMFVAGPRALALR